ncbi:hypothetical protein JHK82_023257 [Glycine max]|nr:hypothetical protein JHK85_023791 [Glycine max]KAG5027401.1 hypothetical protein JHK86_023315 [Glycine max]KAG5138526.1 hypothetical protein JHK82_023257 [Glycine max]
MADHPHHSVEDSWPQKEKENGQRVWIFLANLSDTLVWLSEFSVLRAEEEMGGGNQEAVKQLQTLMENVDDEQLKNTFQVRLLI